MGGVRGGGQSTMGTELDPRRLCCCGAGSSRAVGLLPPSLRPFFCVFLAATCLDAGARVAFRVIALRRAPPLSSVPRFACCVAPPRFPSPRVWRSGASVEKFADVGVVRRPLCQFSAGGPGGLRRGVPSGRPRGRAPPRRGPRSSPSGYRHCVWPRGCSSLFRRRPSGGFRPPGGRRAIAALRARLSASLCPPQADQGVHWTRLAVLVRRGSPLFCPRRRSQRYCLGCPASPLAS